MKENNKGYFSISNMIFLIFSDRELRKFYDSLNCNTKDGYFLFLTGSNTIIQNFQNFKTFVSWSSSLISKKRNFDSVTANSLVY